MWNLQQVKFGRGAICNTCNLHHVQFSIRAICNACNLYHVQCAAHAICITCNLQHLQLATPAICNMCKTNQLDGSASWISWMDQLDGPAGRTSSLYLKPWPFRIFKDWLYIVAASESDEGLGFFLTLMIFYCLHFPKASIGFWQVKG